MNALTKLGCWANRILDKFKALDFLGPLALRLYLAPIFWIAGMTKISDISSFAGWLGSLGLPYPQIMAYLAAGTEIAGAVLLVLGLAVRWISIPLMVTMAVAAVTVHWQNGWQAIASSGSAFASEKLGPLALENAEAAVERLDAAKSLLQEHGNYGWLTESGNFVVLNNGIEFAATYFIMLLVLFFIGAGRYFSIDYYLGKKCEDSSYTPYEG